VIFFDFLQSDWLQKRAAFYDILTVSRVPVYEFVCISFRTDNLTVLGQVDHDGQHGNAARTPIRDEMSETDHTQKRRFRHTAIYQTIKALAILRCLYGSEMVLLGVVIGKCEMPSTNISQENDHAIIIVTRQFVACNFR
jgi:hypothetical protein